MLENTLSGRVKMRTQTSVLIADDDCRERESIERMLRDAGYEVVAEVTDGLEAVEKTYSLLPDVVLMDADLAEVCGFEAAQLIYEMCPTPVVMLTTREASELGDKVSGAGTPTTLLKPPTPAELEEAISMAVERFGVGAKSY